LNYLPSSITAAGLFFSCDVKIYHFFLADRYSSQAKISQNEKGDQAKPGAARALRRSLRERLCWPANFDTTSNQPL